MSPLLACHAFRILLWEPESRRMDHGISLHQVHVPTHQIRCSSILWSGFPIWPSLRVLELFSRRCRWSNGSSFVAMHSTVKFHYIRRSSHTLSRKFLLHIDCSTGLPRAFPIEAMNYRSVPRLVLLTCGLGQTISSSNSQIFLRRPHVSFSFGNRPQGSNRDHALALRDMPSLLSM